MIVVCYKLVPDVPTVKAAPDDSISLKDAEWTVGEYDLVAAEAAAQLAAKTGEKIIGLSAGSAQLENTKLRKNMLSRGCDELFLVQDEELATADSNMTARVLAAALKTMQDVSLVVCGEGSGDMYFRQVGLQVGEMLNVPAINGISKIKNVENGILYAVRSTEGTVQDIEIPLPAVITITADICQSRIPRLQDIMKAGKKPVETHMMEEYGEFSPSVITVSTKAPETTERKNIPFTGTADEIANAIAEVLVKNGFAKGGA